MTEENSRNDSLPRSDRRIPRTRQMLQHALISLALEKRYEAISIKDICEVANVGRSTFYAHFKDKDDLKRSGLDQLRKQIEIRQEAARASSDGENVGLGFSLMIFEHARDHADLYRALVGSTGGDIALDSIRQIVSDIVDGDIRAISKQSQPASVPREVEVRFIVGAFMALLTWWLDNGCRLSPARMDEMFRAMVMHGALASH